MKNQRKIDHLPDYRYAVVVVELTKVHVRYSDYNQSPIFEVKIGKQLVSLLRFDGLWRVTVDFPTRDPHFTRYVIGTQRDFKRAATALLYAKAIIRRNLRSPYER